MLIDESDAKRVNQFKWSSQGHYLRIVRENRNIYLHNFLIGMPVDRSLEVDHINRNPLDNRKKNLRFVTHSENMLNRARNTHCEKGHPYKSKEKQCMVCYKKYKAAYYLLNRDRLLAQQRESSAAYYLANRDKVLAAQRTRYAKKTAKGEKRERN